MLHIHARLHLNILGYFLHTVFAEVLLDKSEDFGVRLLPHNLRFLILATRLNLPNAIHLRIIEQGVSGRQDWRPLYCTLLSLLDNLPLTLAALKQLRRHLTLTLLHLLKQGLAQQRILIHPNRFRN